MNLPFPVPRGNLMFIPAQYLTQSNPEPHHVPARLIKEGKITGTDMRYRGLISFRANGSSKEVVIESLTLGHSGVYEIRDGKQYLVSSTVLEVNGERQDAFAVLVEIPRSFFTETRLCDFYRKTIHVEYDLHLLQRLFWSVSGHDYAFPVPEAIPRWRLLVPDLLLQTKEKARGKPP